jgi:hypothetical protein
VKPLIICFSIFSGFPVSSKAEDPVMLGQRGTLNVFAPVPVKTSQVVRTKAAGMLARHVKPYKGSLLSELKFGGNRVWMEMKGLQLTHVTANAVSQADQANGTLESYMVSVDCEMYRSYDTAAAKWSVWHKGRNPFIPPIIYVERKTTGQWTARLPESSNLIAQRGIGDPHLIPHGTPPPHKPVLTMESAHQPAPSIKAPALPATEKPFDKTAKSPTATSWTGIVILLMIIAAVSAFLNSIKSNKSSGKRRKSGRSGKITPPPFLFQAVSPQPPPLPASAFGQNANPIDLMRRKENLMTPAEQAFFAVLQPIVSSSCMVSSKVRLADLFDVRTERGQRAAFNKISSKHIDFVLTEPGTSRILCGIELDDSSHNRPDRIERDNFVNELFAANQLPLMRVPVAWTYYPQTLRAELLKAGVTLSSAA